MTYVLKNWMSAIGLLLLIIVFTVLSKAIYNQQTFMTLKNWKTILVQSASLAVVALGQSIMLLTGNFDLSLGRLVCLTSCVGATLMVNMGWSLPAALLLLRRRCRIPDSMV